jgi:hypothetical protein
VLLKRLHHPGEVEEAAAEAVHLVHDHAVDAAGLYVGQQAAQRRSVHVAAGEAAVVVPIGQARPSFVRLALHERLARVPLGVQRVELLLQAFLGALARIHRAPNRFSSRPRGRLFGPALHRRTSLLVRRKNA